MVKQRIELHLHTNMSAMDGINTASEYIKDAIDRGMSAIAITDHGVVQAFPEAYKAAKGKDIKLIYGMEAYMVNDIEQCVSGETDCTLDDEFVVVDIETTGLNPKTDRITEIAAYKINNGEITDTFKSLVNPEMEISEEIVELTGITNEMVKVADKVEDVLRSFLGFCGNAIIVAHSNAYSISNLKIYAETDNIGFFGYTNGATINNPYFIGANVTGKDNVGALIGYAENTVVNAANINATMTGNQYVGGVVGYAKKSTINGTFNSGSMLTVTYSGGLVGMLDESTLMNCENFISIEAMEPYTGGIAGYVNNSTIVNSYNMANINGASYVGGVTGKSVNSTIENVYSVGTITGTSVVGGFVGEIDNEVKSCYYMDYDNPVASGSSNGLTKMASAPIMMSLLNK